LATWIFLRGWSREARHWGRFPGQFRATMPTARVLPVDLPGSGTLHDRPSPATVKGMMEQTRQRLVAQGVKAPYCLLGLSLGAMVCVDWAAEHPGEVEACALLSTSLRPFSPFYERLRPRNYLAILQLALFERDPAIREAAILKLTSSKLDDAADLAATWARFGLERPVSRINVIRQLAAAARYRAPEASPQVPVLLLAGAADRLVSPRCSEAISRRWSAPLAVHPTAGHDLPLDDGGWVAGQVKAWAGRYGLTRT
jgi:pimeloyl-ACP methyl ester carboxylesterase